MCNVTVSIFYLEKPDGTIEAVIQNPAVPSEVLSEILLWRSEGATDVDVITRLRQRTVPSGFETHTWTNGISPTRVGSQNIFMLMYIGQTEERVHMLRSILAQMEYCYEVCRWDSAGVPFRTHMYVPETHHITGEPFLEREDEGHVFKVVLKEPYYHD